MESVTFMEKLFPPETVVTYGTMVVQKLDVIMADLYNRNFLALGKTFVVKWWDKGVNSCIL